MALHFYLTTDAVLRYVNKNVLIYSKRIFLSITIINKTSNSMHDPEIMSEYH